MAKTETYSFEINNLEQITQKMVENLKWYSTEGGKIYLHWKSNEIDCDIFSEMWFEVCEDILPYNEYWEEEWTSGTKVDLWNELNILIDTTLRENLKYYGWVSDQNGKLVKGEEWTFKPLKDSIKGTIEYDSKTRETKVSIKKEIGHYYGI